MTFEDLNYRKGWYDGWEIGFRNGADERIRSLRRKAIWCIPLMLLSAAYAGFLMGGAS